MSSTDLRGVHGLVVDRLGRAMADGTLTGRLDPDLIAKAYCVSRSVVRESLRALEAKGMVRARQRTGTWVTPMSDWSLLDPNVIAWRVAGSERLHQLRDAIELRRALEPLGAELVATRGSDTAREALRAAAARIADAATCRDVPALIEADTEFHTGLLRGSGNAMLAQLAATVAACLRVADVASIDRITDDVADRHNAVVTAIDAGNSAGAYAAALQLVEYSRSLLDDALTVACTEQASQPRALSSGIARATPSRSR